MSVDEVSLTRSDLIVNIASDFKQLPLQDVEESVKMIIGCLTQALSEGDRVEIRGFGSFSVNYRHSRVGRNPKSGEAVALSEKYVPRFRPGKELRERVQQGIGIDNHG